MWNRIVGLFTGSATAIWAYLALAGIVVGILLGARSAGRQAEQIANMKKTLEAVKVRDEIKNTVAAGDPDNIAELRRKWTRKD
jgi:hypothetical protein